MKNNYILILMILVVSAFGFQNVTAQITINIPNLPKIPKVKKNKPEQQQPQAETTPADNRQSKGNQSENNQTSRNNQEEEKSGTCSSNPVASLVEDEVTKMTEQIGNFDPAGDNSFYYVIPTYNYLLISVSPAAKQEWNKKFNFLECPKIAAGFEKLSAVAAKKLPVRLPEKADYPIRNAAEENLMKAKINDLAGHKIHHIGIKQANWLIDKNSIGIPNARYKHGRAWVRYTKDDHPYCRTYYINIVQDYAGGGTYGASYGNFVDEGLVGCPAGTTK